MGIEKPYEVETGRLEWAPGPPTPVPIEERVHRLIQGEGDLLLIAGVPLRIAPERCEEEVRRLRERIVSRFRERRPHADEATWDRFADDTRAVVAEREGYDRSVRRDLTLLIDGL